MGRLQRGTGNLGSGVSLGVWEDSRHCIAVATPPCFHHHCSSHTHAGDVPERMAGGSRAKLKAATFRRDLGSDLGKWGADARRGSQSMFPAVAPHRIFFVGPLALFLWAAEISAADELMAHVCHLLKL